MIREILILALLIAPVCAWQFNNGTVNLTESELLEIVLTARAAGAGDTHEVFAKSAYAAHALSYGDLWKYTNTNNEVIRDYNLIMDKFNESIAAQWKLTEYSI